MKYATFVFAVFVVAVTAFATIFMSAKADAAVCANGVYRAGCAGPRGAVVVRKRKPVVVAPIVVTPVVKPIVVVPVCTIVNGVKVCR
jgi:hypothetical protein